jgi:hypothetical protein
MTSLKTYLNTTENYALEELPYEDENDNIQ